jgi:hypothetical protein
MHGRDPVVAIAASGRSNKAKKARHWRAFFFAKTFQIGAV